MTVDRLKDRLKLKKGDRLRHRLYGECSFLRCDKDGAVWVRFSDGIEGTCDVRSLENWKAERK